MIGRKQESLSHLIIIPALCHWDDGSDHVKLGGYVRSAVGLTKSVGNLCVQNGYLDWFLA